MPTLSIGFDPQVDDYDDVIAIIDAAYNLTPAPAEDDDTDATPLPDGWTHRRMKSYVTLLSPDGRKVLRYMAEHQEADIDDVQAAVGSNGFQYAGMMSTFGHAKRLAPGGHNLPFTKHARRYYINEQVAKLALTVLDEIGA